MNVPEPEIPAETLDQIHSELFIQLVSGHAQIAMMFLGRYPNPQTGQTETPQMEAAKIYLDQLEMIQAKTKGNLSVEEGALLRQLLTAVQIAFVEVMETQVGASGMSAD